MAIRFDNIELNYIKNLQEETVITINANQSVLFQSDVTASSGNITAGAVGKASDTVMRVLAGDSNKAGFEAYGNSQGTGYLYVGQSSTYGGGISYNGDNSPSFISGESTDRITFFRRNAGTSSEVFNYSYAADNVYFNGDIAVGANSTPLNFGFLERVIQINAGSSSSSSLQQAGLVISGSSDADDADDFGYISFVNHQSTLSNDRVAEIRAYKSGTNVNTGQIRFFTANGTSLNQAMEINQNGDVIIEGNLTVSGTTTTLNTQTVEVEDNILQLNTTQGSPDTATATESGISIYRGSGVTQASFIFDDADDTWDLTNNLRVAGNLIVNGNSTGIHVDSATHASINLDRASTSYDNNLIYRTNGVIKWRLWQDGSDDFLYIRDEANTSNIVSFQTGGNTTFAGDVTISKSVGDAVLTIEADTDNNVENDNPRIELKQDGGVIYTHLGINGDANNTFTGALGNYGYLRTNTGLHFVVNATVPLMVLDQNNRIGIGTSTPSQKVHVVGGQIRLDGTGGFYKHDASGNFRAAFYDDGAKTRIYGDGNGTDAAITIDSNKVGIFTTNPVEVLDITGNIKLSGAGPIIVMNSTNAASGGRINVTGLDQDGDDLLRIQDNGTTKFEIHRNGDLANSLIPFLDSTYDLGSTSKYWRNLYVDNIDMNGTFNPLSLVSKVYSTSNTSSSISAGTSLDDEYELLTFGESASPVYLNIKTAAHNSASFVITRGYFGNNSASIHCTGSTYTANGGYANLRGIRVIKDNNNAYKVIVRLYRSGSHVGFSLYARAWGGTATEDIGFNTTLTDTFTESTDLGGIEDLSVVTSLSAAYSRDTLYADNAKARFGNASDLQIYHDGSDSHIRDAGTGRLNIRTTQFRVANAANSEILIDATEDGSVKLYHNNGLRFETIAGGVRVPDNYDIQLWDSNATSSTGQINLARSGAITFYGNSGHEHSITSRDANFNASDDLRINSFGAVYINLDSNNNNTSSADFRIGRHGAVSTILDWLFKVDGETGNVGIATTSPDSKLTINGGVNNVWSYSTTTTDQPGFVAANNTEYSTSTNILYSKIYGSGITATSFGVTLADYAVVASQGSDNNGLLFGTFNSTPIIIGTNATERMRIDSSGRVGIGTTNPYGLVEIYGNGNSWSAGPAIRFWDSTNSKGWLVGNINNQTAGDFYIRTLPSISGNPGTSNLEFVIKHSSGNVGIGTLNPTSALTINKSSGAVGILLEGDGTDVGKFQVASAGVNHAIQFGTISNNEIQFHTANTEKMRLTSDGKLGIGITNPEEKLHVNGNLKIENGGLVVQNSTAHGYVAIPEGAYYHSVTGYETGAIKITLPVHGTADMLSFVVDIYDYSTNESITVYIKGYLYQQTGNNEWVNLSVQIIASDRTRNYAVRFGADGSNNCVWIGETNTVWTYPQVQVRDFTSGFNTNIDSFTDGWDVSIVTSFDTVDETVINTFPISKEIENSNIRIANSASSYLNGGNVGIGTVSPSRKLHVSGPALIANAGNVNKGTLMLGSQTSGADKWSTITGAHYNAASGSGNGSGSAGIMMIGTLAQNGENVVIIGGAIYEANAATNIRFYTHTTDTSTAGGSERMRITSSGRVGIGITSPAEKLHVNGNLKVQGTITEEGDGNNVTYKKRTDESSSYTSGNALVKFGRIYWTPAHWSDSAPVLKITIQSRYYEGESRTYIVKANYQDTDPIVNQLQQSSTDLKIAFSLGATTSAGYNYAGQPVYYADLRWVQSSYMKAWVIIESQVGFLSSNPTSGWGGCVIDSSLTQTNGSGSLQNYNSFFNGDLGIGTESPQAKLHVVGNIYNTGRTQSVNTLIGSQNISATAFATLGSNSSGTGIAIARDHAPASYPDIIINSSGNVGIGDASPSEKLDVNGNIRLRTGVLSSNNGTISHATNNLLYVFGGSSGLYLSDNTGQQNSILIHDTNYIDFQTAATRRLRIDSSGRMLVGLAGSGNIYVGGSTTGQYFRIHHNNSDTYLDGNGGKIYFRGDSGANTRFEMDMTGTNAGQFIASGDIVAFGSPSDKTLKENIKPIENALDKVNKLEGVEFNWKEQGITNLNEDIGFIAQDVQEVLPQLVRENESGKLSLRHQGIVPVLVEAIKELTKEIETLKTQINN